MPDEKLTDIAMAARLRSLDEQVKALGLCVEMIRDDTRQLREHQRDTHAELVRIGKMADEAQKFLHNPIGMYRRRLGKIPADGTKA